MSKVDLSSVRARVERDAAAKLDAQRRVSSQAADPTTSTVTVATYPSKNLVMENGRYHAVNPEK